MAEPASYAEIVEYLRGRPAASVSWAEGMYSLSLSMAAVITLVNTMSEDAESPLREAQEGIMSTEIVRLNLARGRDKIGKVNGTRFTVRIRNVLNSVETTRVINAVNGFCQPVFDTRGNFGRNGHAVMNAVRRACAAYMAGRLPKEARIIEVGPDVRNSMLSPTASRWIEKGPEYYVGARPLMGPRDVLRTDWRKLAHVIVKSKGDGFSSSSLAAASMMLEYSKELFPECKIQDLNTPGEYIMSYDSNYDIAFSDMPRSMALCGARVWSGCMVRAKGLTRASRLSKGALDNLGVTYRVDWKDGRIDFRHPECSAFGYSHNVWEYMKYEENNGYVWTSPSCHYVYSKGPETTTELLFFSVVRVSNALRLVEPRYVENVFAKLLRVHSVWAVGDEMNGVPTKFQPIVFHVDALNFSKVLEKRRALDFKGDLSVTINHVRSTNVRFWLNGTPVGASERIAGKLAEATAVVIETVVCDKRRESNRLFESAMRQFDVTRKKDGLILRLLNNVIDMRAAIGAVSGPVDRMWNNVRGIVADAALSSISQLSVGYEQVKEHVALGAAEQEVLEESVRWGTQSSCKCMEISECETALFFLKGPELEATKSYLSGLRKVDVECDCRRSLLDKALPEKSEEEDAVDDQRSIVEDSADEFDEDDVQAIDVSETWRSERNSSSLECKAMTEFAELELYLQNCLMIEIRVDVDRINREGHVTDTLLSKMSTTRTIHNYVKVLAGKVVERVGTNFGEYAAIYNSKADKLEKVTSRGGNVTTSLTDGWYYTNNRLAVWNFEEIFAAYNYAMDYGRVHSFRKTYEVTIGVPGAGKTYSMMQQLWSEYSKKKFMFYVLSATKAAANAAKVQGIKFGFPKDIMDARIMSADKYLMHNKRASDVLCVDEYVAMHLGKVDVLATLTGAEVIRLYGDAQQIPYDPFTAEFKMNYNVIGDTVPLANVKFMPMTHRFGERMCAVWIDKYPTIYPCDCCHSEEKQQMQLKLVRVKDISSVPFDKNFRYHTYKQAEKEDLKNKFGLTDSLEALRALSKGGLATVHEDQGSTHDHVVSVRLHTEYDKNASERNPSLHNRQNYVLSDFTRAKYSYTYYTLCEENDEVCKRIAMADDKYRLKCVREKQSFGDVSIYDMLC